MVIPGPCDLSGSCSEDGKASGRQIGVAGGRRERNREGWKHSSGDRRGQLLGCYSRLPAPSTSLKEAAEGPVILSITITL